ncbi:MAG: hypothetical protein HY445_00015 [Candidatus Niyogibacteria bacterium]|nr:hypothetical protein [Candidatus Niyogibacteria bacterium]
MPQEIKTSFSWHAPEYVYHEKDGRWYAILGIITLLLLGIAFFLNNFLFGILIIVASFALALYGAKRPKIVTFSLTTQGIRIDDRLYPYENIRSFWLHYDPPAFKELSIVFRKTIMPRLTLPLEDADPNEIREILIKYVSEKPHDQTLSDTLSRVLRF